MHRNTARFDTEIVVLQHSTDLKWHRVVTAISIAFFSAVNVDQKVLVCALVCLVNFQCTGVDSTSAMMSETLLPVTDLCTWSVSQIAVMSSLLTVCFGNFGSNSSLKRWHWCPKTSKTSSGSCRCSRILGGVGLITIPFFGNFFGHSSIFLADLRCPLLGQIENLDGDEIACVMSILPSITGHCPAPMLCW